MSLFANTLGLDTRAWTALKSQFFKLIEEHPNHQLGGPHPNAVSKFLNRHARTLHEAGIVVRLRSGTWLADPARFPDAALLLATGGTLPPMAAASPPAPPSTRPRPAATSKVKRSTRRNPKTGMPRRKSSAGERAALR